MKRAHRIAKGHKIPVRLMRSYARDLRAWFAPLQERLRAAAVAESRLRKDARAGSKTLEIITHEAVMRPPVGVIATQAKAVNAYNAQDAQRVLGVAPASVLPHDKIQKFVNANVDRIQSIAQEQLSDVAALVAQAQSEGWHVDQLAEALTERFEVADSKAIFIARDQTLKFNGDLTEARQTGAGISRYIWTTSNDERVREDHAALEGTEQSWSAPPVVNEKTDERAHPGRDFQCRCTAFPVLDF